ncbi:MAG: hypothetical protein FRX49_06148 [Trebouxia sp. A1-2]|nr:MAG: hypothetical protein FRX49_06148 [Trebouxia sp. A1-2]
MHNQQGVHKDGAIDRPGSRGQVQQAVANSQGSKLQAGSQGKLTLAALGSPVSACLQPLTSPVSSRLQLLFIELLCLGHSIVSNRLGTSLALQHHQARSDVKA